MLKVFYTAHIEETEPSESHQTTLQSEPSGCSNPSEFIVEDDCEEGKDDVTTTAHEEDLIQPLVTLTENMSQPLVTLTDDFCSPSPYDDKASEEYAVDETETAVGQQQDQVYIILNFKVESHPSPQNLVLMCNKFNVRLRGVDFDIEVKNLVT